MNETIEKAVEQFRANAGRYRRTSRYYTGDQNLSFASAKFENTFGSLFREFALNMCPAIVDSIRDKLKISGFGIHETELQTGIEDRDQIAAAIDRVWRKNRMAGRSGDLHKEALKNGDAYLIVWRGPGDAVQMVPNPAESCTVGYDAEDPGRISWAAKHWQTGDGRTRMNLYFADRIERYAANTSAVSLLSEKFVPVDRASGLEAVTPNPYGIVPVFHFANDPEMGVFGTSELEQAIPVQDGLNKSVLDMLVAMEVCAYRQRWAAGIEIQFDKEGNAVAPFKAGIDHLWLAENPDARFGDFAAADLEQFLKVKDGFRIDLASVTGTPLYYLLPQARVFPSGEAQRKAETRFLAKVRDRQSQFGVVWEEAMSFAARLAGFGDVVLRVKWEEASPVGERERLENLRLKMELGVSPEQALNEAGYGDEESKDMQAKEINK